MASGDITDSKLLADAFPNPAAFPERNPFPVLSVGRDGTLLYANRGSARLLEEWQIAIGGSLPGPVRQTVESALAKGLPGDLEVNSDGRDISFMVIPLPELGYANLYGRDVTAHRQAEEELSRLNAELEERVAEQTHEVRRAYELLDGFMKSTKDIIVTVDRGLHLTSFNQAFKDELKKAFGLDIEIGMSVGEGLENFPEDRDRVLSSWDRALGGETFTLEQELGDPGRQRSSYQFDFTPILDPEGRIVGAAHVVRDVTARRRAEAEAGAERQRLHDVLEMLPAYAILLAADYHVPFANRFFRERFGESHGRRCYEYLFNRTEPCEICETYTVLKTNAPHRWEWTGPDGRNYDIHDFPFRGADGSSLILEVGLDITDRKRVEEQLRSTNQSLQQLAAIVESSDDAIVGKNLDGVIISWNHGAESLYGYTAEEVLGKPIGSLVPPDRPDEVPGILELIRRGERVEHYETVRIRKDGSRLTVSLAVSPIKDAAGRIVGASTIARGITERKRMEEELRVASLYARSLIEASLDPLVTISPDGRIMDVNEATELVTGVARDRLIGSSFSNYFTEPHRAEEGYQKVLGEGLVRDYPLTIRHASGRTTDVLYNATVYRNEAGQVQGVFAAARDVTEHKRLEAELRVASLYSRSLIEASLDPLVTISPDGQITDVNEATEQVTGVPRDRLIGSDFSEYFTEPDKARAGYRKVLSDGLVRDYPLTIRNVEGRTTDVLYNAVLYRNEAGQVQGVFAAARDVTERKRLEEDLRVASLYARSLLEASLDPLVTISPDGQITDVNEAAEQVTGVPRDRLVGSDFSDYFTEPDRARAGYRKVFSDGLVRDYPLTIRHVEGHTTDVLYNAVLYRNEAGQVQGIFAAARDVTERKLAEAELARYRGHLEELVQQRTSELETANTHLQRTTAELVRSNQELEQFAYVASHDLQEPLRAVTGYLGLLEKQFGDELDDKGRHYVAGAVQGAARMHTLITDLLALSRVGTRGQVFETADLNVVLSQALDGLGASVRETGARITRDPLPTLRVDASQAVQLFQNLIGNALKFRGERPPEVHVSAERKSGQWVFAVRDNGIGIEPQYFQRIFMVFQRLHTRRHYPGTGIGLAICKKIVERHGGTIWVESQPDQGSTFCFTIPERDML